MGLAQDENQAKHGQHVYMWAGLFGTLVFFGRGQIELLIGWLELLCSPLREPGQQ